MARTSTCTHNGREIGISEALKMRDKNGTRNFFCPRCRLPLVAFKGPDGPHFEHTSKTDCSG